MPIWYVITISLTFFIFTFIQMLGFSFPFFIAIVPLFFLFLNNYLLSVIPWLLSFVIDSILLQPIGSSSLFIVLLYLFFESSHARFEVSSLPFIVGMSAVAIVFYSILFGYQFNIFNIVLSLLIVACFHKIFVRLTK